MIQERTARGGAQDESIHREILEVAQGHPVTLVVIADEAHRRGLAVLAKRALSALEQTGKRVADVRRLRTLLHGPAPIFPDAEEEAIESLLTKGLTGLARERLARARRHWPNNPAWQKWDEALTREE